MISFLRGAVDDLAQRSQRCAILSKRYRQGLAFKVGYSRFHLIVNRRAEGAFFVMASICFSTTSYCACVTRTV